MSLGRKLILIEAICSPDSRAVSDCDPETKIHGQNGNAVR